MRAAALICLIAGVPFPLLLNGQTFTNSLIGIAFSSAAVALCVAAERARSLGETTWSGRIIAVLGVLLAIVLLVQLPAAYTFQNSFNRSTEEFRQKHAATRAETEGR